MPCITANELHIPHTFHQRQALLSQIPQQLDASETIPDNLTSLSNADALEESQRKLRREIDLRLGVISRMVAIVVVWLYLCRGISMQTSNIIIAAFRTILLALLKTIALLIPSSTIPDITIPRDVRTIITQLDLDPSINRTICCPKCYSIYDTMNLPEKCTWRETRRSRRCRERLCKRKYSRIHGTKLIPRTLLSSQPFEKWLSFLLSRPKVEKYLDDCAAHVPNEHVLRSIWDSPAWKSLFTYTAVSTNLVFSLYFDWFNPFTNKIGGKGNSCGALMLCCLNLPEELRFRPEYMYFAGIIPGPHEQTVITIAHIMNPLVDQLLTFWQGRTLTTARSPTVGRLIRAAIIPYIADLVAMRKIIGYGSHASRYFCTWCLCPRDELEELDLSKYGIREGNAVRTEAQRWYTATTKVARKEIFKQCSVRWSPFYRFPYFDAVWHIVLGWMHNWEEGVLQHHSRSKWGIGAKEPKKPKADAPLTLGDELRDLEEESSGHDTPRSETRDRRSTSFDESQINNDPTNINLMDMDWGSDAGGSEYKPSGSDDSDSDDDDPGKIVDPLAKVCVFSKEELNLIRTCFRDASIPSTFERPPANFGEASHGTLKAHTWLMIFSIFLPMVLPEIWAQNDTTERNTALLDNFCHLVAATNLVSSYAYHPNDADQYDQHYISYRRGCSELFTTGSTPNHHYAMHNARMMRYWGPLPLLSEDQYEQKNGMFQKQNHNHRHNDMENSMFLRVVQRGRLEAFLSDPHVDPDMQQLASVLTDVETYSPHQTPLSSAEQADFLFKAQPLSRSNYENLLQYVNQGGPLWRDWLEGEPYFSTLPVRAQPIRFLNHMHRRFASRATHEANSCVLFYDPIAKTNRTGFIINMWTVLLPPKLEVIMMVTPHSPFVNDEDNNCSPFLRLPELQTKIVSTLLQDSHLMLRLTDIIGQCVLWQRPRGTYNISESFYVVNYAAHRKRSHC